MALPRLTAAVALLALAAGLLVALPPAPAGASDLPVLSFVSTTVSDFESNAMQSTTFTFEITLDKTPTQQVRVHWYTTNGSATSPQDYNHFDSRVESAPVVFEAGVEPGTKPLNVTVLGNNTPEADKTFQVNLVDEIGATVATRTATGVILNDDGPTIRFEATSVIVKEPAAGQTVEMTFTVEAVGGEAVNQQWGGDVQVGYRTVVATDDDLNGSETKAEKGTDYTHVEGTLTIPDPGTPQGTAKGEFKIKIHGNDVYQGGSNNFTVFMVELFRPQFGAFRNGAGVNEGPLRGKGRIEDGDSAPTATVSDAEVIAKGTSSTVTSYQVPVTLSHPSAFPIELTYSTSDGTADHNDYVAVPPATKVGAGDGPSFPARATTTHLTVQVKGNDTPEPNKDFFVHIAEAPAQDLDDVVLTDDSKTSTITALNARGPVFRVSDVSDLEGNAGETKDFVFEVELTEASPHTVVISYETKPGDREIGNATADQDYVSVEGELTFAPGETKKTVPVTVLGNDFPGFHEVFYLDIFDAVIPDGPTDTPPLPTIQKRRGIGEILNDDGPELRVSDATVVRTASTKEIRFPVTLSAPMDCPEDFHKKWGCDVLVDYETRNGTAIAGEHYTKAKGTLRIPRGQSTGTITVKIDGGGDPAPTRQFELRLDWAQFALTVDRRVTGTILNGNGPTISIADLTVKRSETEVVDAVFKLGLSQASTDVVRVDFATVDGTSKAGEDYIGRTGTVQFAPGETSAQVVVKVLAGRRSGTFSLKLSNPAYGVLGSKTSATATVDGLDPPPGSGDPDGDVLRSWGQDRIETAVMASREYWDAASDAVVATARRFPDALAAGALAAKLDAPLLLTEEGALPALVAEELDRLGVTRVWLMGGTAAVSAAVEDALVAAGYDVTRIAGEDRFETAAKVADEVGASAASEAMVALGIHAEEHRAWPDALSAGALSAGPDRLPTLLTRGGELPEVTEAALDRLGVSRVYLLGGTAAIAQAVEDRLAELGYEVVRLAGEDRYGTSVAVAAEALRRHAAAKLPVVFATGQNYPDGLAAGALAARLGGLVLLVPPDDLERAPGTRDFLHDNQGRLSGGVVVGGPAALAEAVLTQLRTALGL